MKLFFKTITFCFMISLFACSSSNEPYGDDTEPVEFQVYDDYSYRGPTAESDCTFFYCITSREEFDSLFFFIFDHNTNDTIPSADFLTKTILSIVKYGNDYYEMVVKDVCLNEQTLEIKYNCELIRENMSWTAAIPVIITVDVDFDKVSFIENDYRFRDIIL